MSRLEDVNRQIASLHQCDRLYTDPYKLKELEDLEAEKRDIERCKDTDDMFTTKGD